MTRVSPHLLSRISCSALLTFGSDQALCGAILGTMGCGTASLTPTHLMDAWSAPLPYLMSPDSTECRQVGTVGFPPSWALDLNSSLKSFFSTYWLWAMSYVLCCYCSVAKSCLTLCNPMDCSTPGFPVLHYLPEFSQIHVHWVSDVIQPSLPLSSPSPSALNLSQHRSLSQWVGSSHQVAKELKLQYQSFQWMFCLAFFFFFLKSSFFPYLK